jgi:glutathione synthase/RimK-type ligase-like ATP-grasp enzyme
MLLVIGTSVDSHIDAVVAHLPSTMDVVRLNVDCFPAAAQMSWSLRNNGQQSLYIEGMSDDLAKADVVWFRRQGKHMLNPRIRNAAHRSFAHNETEAFIQSLDSMFPQARWLNRYHAVKRATSKPLQLLTAQACGLTVPSTCVTNSPSEAAAFLRVSPDAVYKTLSSPSVSYATHRSLIFTRRLSVADYPLLEDVKHAPCQLQEYINKDYELRITYTGETFYAVKIYSQDTTRGQVDWRAAGLGELRYETTVIPSWVADALRKLLDTLELQYAAIDMIVTTDGRYVFLEANPHGAWLWLERAVNVPIAAGIARTITLMHKGVPR